MRKKRIKKNPYRNQLMLSEWLTDVPEDFSENWLFTICPVGKRCLVIASYGTTSAYNRMGQLINNFPSLLPGGSGKTYRIASRDYSILDCIYHEVLRTFYVLDVMCWHGHPVYDSDTEFRSYWKQTKLHDEGDKLSKYSRINPLTFEDLRYYPCTVESLSEVLGSKWPVEVDGVLFVHKQAHYRIGRTPLASWLKPSMIPELLKISVSEEFLSCVPTLPVGMETSSASSKERKERATETMDTSQPIATTDK